MININPILLLPIILSFLVTLILLPHWIKRTREVGHTGKDINKIKSEDVSESGGLCVISGFIIGILSYIALKTFYFKTETQIIEIFALISTISIVAFIGIIDDIFGWKIGLSRRSRLFWVLIASIPLMVINAGNSDITIPFIDGANIGILYALIIIPLGIIGASTTFNFLAGYNGLEAGMGILIIGALSVFSYSIENSSLALIGLCMISALTAFLIFNKYPAKVFPGDVLTYPVGAMIAVMAILGNFEKFALFIFIPYFIEIILKIRGKLKKESFAKPNPDGTIDLKYDKIYGLEHLMIYLIKKLKPNHKAYEYEIVFSIWTLEFIIIIIGFSLF
jgi:UDP-N-acetylglucosamine--dolichyl-phosphate N-acetylglucosaminephosphotransferase